MQFAPLSTTERLHDNGGNSIETNKMKDKAKDVLEKRKRETNCKERSFIF